MDKKPPLKKRKLLTLEGIKRATKRIARDKTQTTQERVKAIKEQLVGSTPVTPEQPSTPMVTSDTLAKHRETVLSKARRFKYPLRTRTKVVRTSIGIVIGLLLATFAFSAIILYGFKSTGSFAYNLSKLLPFPVARVDGSFVSFERYLFEARHNLFYLANHGQEGVDIGTEEGQGLVLDTKQRSMEKILVDKLAEKLAGKNGIRITDQEIDREIDLFKQRGGIDQSGGALEAILSRYYDWDVDDLRRVVKLQLIYQKLLPVLDTAAVEKADQAAAEIAAGATFEATVLKYSDDTISKTNGGRIGTISHDSLDWTDEIIAKLFSMEAGQVSSPVASPGGMHIFKVTAKTDTTVEVSQILINFFDINTYLSGELQKVPHDVYLRID